MSPCLRVPEKQESNWDHSWLCEILSQWDASICVMWSLWTNQRPGICSIVLMSQTQIPGLSHPRYCHHYQQYKMWIRSGCLMDLTISSFNSCLRSTKVGLSTETWMDIMDKCLSSFVNGSCIDHVVVRCSWQHVLELPILGFCKTLLTKFVHCNTTLVN